jgi:hypothetical protein
MINDSYRTDACLYYPPHTIGACRLSLVACRLSSMPLPTPFLPHT